MITAELQWEWSALETARSVTSEEDALMRFVGRPVLSRGHRSALDFSRCHLARRPPLGQPFAMPDQDVWERRVSAVNGGLEPALPRYVEHARAKGVVRARRGDVKAAVLCGEDGTLAVSKVQMSSWIAVDVPRQWDDPRRRPDRDARLGVQYLAECVAKALGVWEARLPLLYDGQAT